MMKNLVKFVALAQITLMSTACVYVVKRDGSGQYTSESRELGAFRAIETQGAIDLVVWDADANFVVLEGDDNLVPEIETRIERGRLIIAPAGGQHFSPMHPLRASVAARHVDEIVVAGSGSLTVESHVSDRLTVKILGSGKATLEGFAHRLDTVIQGSARIDAHRFEADVAHVRIEGSGSTSVCALDELDITIAGSGSVTYYCSPAHVRKSVAGSGAIVQR